ncbi:MAG TPA: TIGR03067 domain-containing protein [Lacunisphaera sp.]|nr:TIGR03067 domain-containing protein [Lacunisphaera sp.]
MSAPLAGRWEMIKAELAGENAPEMLALRVELELTDSTYTVRFAGQVADQGTYVLDGPTLTLTGTRGPNEGRVIPCILQLAGDRLRVCYGLDGTAPITFTTTPGVQHYLATYRRKA